MRKGDVISEDEELGVLEDRTEALVLRSKRTERTKKKKQKRRGGGGAGNLYNPDGGNGGGGGGLLGLPYELISEILAYLRPSDVFRLRRVSRSLNAYLVADERGIASSIIRRRYRCLAKCCRLPLLLADVDPAIHPHLMSAERQELMAIHKKPYSHIQPPDPAEICTCLTCMLRWSTLCLVVDFAHWQDNLDAGEPIPMVPRGRNPAWNAELVGRNAALVRRALRSALWHAVLLEAHLGSTVRAIARHAANRGNKRRRFRMTPADAASGHDGFLEGGGPASFDFPFHRDNYYMLEAYLPNRGWSAEEERWMYVPAEQHDRDIEFVTVWAERRRRRAVVQQGQGQGQDADQGGGGGGAGAGQERQQPQPQPQPQPQHRHHQRHEPPSLATATVDAS